MKPPHAATGPGDPGGGSHRRGGHRDGAPEL